MRVCVRVHVRVRVRVRVQVQVRVHVRVHVRVRVCSKVGLLSGADGVGAERADGGRQRLGRCHCSRSHGRCHCSRSHGGGTSSSPSSCGHWRNAPLRAAHHGDEVSLAVVVRSLLDAAHAEAAVDAVERRVGRDREERLALQRSRDRDTERSRPERSRERESGGVAARCPPHPRMLATWRCPIRDAHHRP